MSVVYSTIPSPVGELLIAAQDGALIRVAFECEGFSDVLAGHEGAQRNDEDAVLSSARSQLNEYFAGKRKTFDVPLAGVIGSEFRQKVLTEIAHITYGETLSYAELATRAGNPDAVRAVGTACGSNPLPLVVPCHRVVRSDGSTGAYLGGEEAKKWLLHHEQGS